MTRVGKKHVKGFVGKLQGKWHLEDLVIEGRILLKLISNRL